MGKTKKPRSPLSPESLAPWFLEPQPPFLKPRDPWFIDPPTKTATAINEAINRDLPEIIRKAKDEAAREKASRGGTASGKKRREAPRPNPIIEFIEKKLKRDWGTSNADIGDALKVEAQTGNADGSITMSDDGTAFVVMDNGKVKNRLAITSVPAKVSRLRKNSKMRLTRSDSR
jgi:hypothetical protein